MMNLKEHIESFDDSCEEYSFESHGWDIPMSDRDRFIDDLRYFILTEKGLEGFEVVHREKYVVPEAMGTEANDSFAVIKFKDRFYKVWYSQDSWDDLGIPNVDLYGDIEEVEPFLETVVRYRKKTNPSGFPYDYKEIE